MLTKFFANRSKAIMSVVYPGVTREIITTVKENSKNQISAGQAALEHVNDLYKKGQLEEALKEIIKIEEKYPGCSKAAKYYRGEVSYAILEKTGNLKKIGPLM